MSYKLNLYAATGTQKGRRNQSDLLQFLNGYPSRTHPLPGRTQCGGFVYPLMFELPQTNYALMRRQPTSPAIPILGN